MVNKENKVNNRFIGRLEREYMKIVSIEWLTDEVTEQLNNEETCYLSSDKEYWLFTDDNVFNKIGKELHSISVAEWLYGKCEDNDLSTTFMNTQYDWSDYNMDAAADVDVSKCCNNQWDQVMINYVRNVVEESISYKLEESLREMVNYKFEMDYIKDAIKNVLDLEDKQQLMKPSFHVEGMNNMNDALEQRLAAKKRDLENQQEYFRIDMKNIEQSNYEDNAINALLYMKKLKTEIAELELVMQLKKTNEL